MRMGQSIGLTDQLLRDIHVGDLLTDADGVEYTVDKYARAVPTKGGNEVPIRKLKGCEIKAFWTPAPDAETEAQADEPEKPAAEPEEKSEEEKQLELINLYVHAAGDQRLVAELRARGWTVTCTKTVEKIVYEEVAL